MRPEPIALAFAGEPYTIRPLTLRQVQRIELAEARRQLELKPAVDADGNIDRAAVLANVDVALGNMQAVIRIALERDHPQVAEQIDDLPVRASEVSAAYEAILDLGGFKRIQASGEAEAAEMARIFGARSTAA
jgi:hypothetical protein